MTPQTERKQVSTTTMHVIQISNKLKKSGRMLRRRLLNIYKASIRPRVSSSRDGEGQPHGTTRRKTIISRSRYRSAVTRPKLGNLRSWWSMNLFLRGLRLVIQCYQHRKQAARQIPIAILTWVASLKAIIRKVPWSRVWIQLLRVLLNIISNRPEMWKWVPRHT